MKKQRKHSKLKDKKFPERTTSGIDISSLLQSEFKTEVTKMWEGKSDDGLVSPGLLMCEMRVIKIVIMTW